MKCGTPSEYTELLSFTSKRIPFGSGYDDDDSDTESTNLANGSARKRKKMLDDMVKMSNKQNQLTSELVEIVKSLISSSKPHYGLISRTVQVDRPHNCFGPSY